MEPRNACPDCSTAFETGDNYCRNCGMFLAAEQALALAPPEPEVRAVQPFRPGLPSPAVRAAAAVAVGTALQFGLAFAMKALASSAREVTRPAPRSPRTRQAERAGPKEIIVREPVQPPANTAEVIETVIFQRRWRFRD